MSNTEEEMTVKQASEFLKLSVPTVIRYIIKGYIKARKVGPSKGKYFLNRDSVIEVKEKWEKNILN